MKIVITSGGTSEYIDSVRKITNSGSGRLGSMIADALADDKNEIWYIHTPKAIMPTKAVYHDVEIIGTMDLKRNVEDILQNEEIDWFIQAMAVSDYVVDSVTTPEMLIDNIKTHGVNISSITNNVHTLNRLDKISSDEDNLVLTLKKAPKIIGMVKQLSPETKLIGFKLLSHATKKELFDAAFKQIEKNGCEFVVANLIDEISANGHHAYFINKDGQFYEGYTKREIACKIAKIIM